MKKTLNVGIVGCGYWGPNLARNFAAEMAFFQLRHNVVAVGADGYGVDADAKFGGGPPHQDRPKIHDHTHRSHTPGQAANATRY